MNELVFLEPNCLNKIPFTTSKIIAENGKVKHHAVTKLIQTYENDIKEFGILRFEIEEIKGRGQPEKIYKLNEEQATLLITYMKNTLPVRKFKKALVKEFMRMKKTLLRILARQENAQWQELRKTGKVTRLYETDTIKTFVDYAINQGSQNANRYYTNISKMENKHLFLLEQKYPNVRDLLTGQQILTIGAADQVIEKALRDGMLADLPYKDIYVKAKENIETFATIMGLSKVPDDNFQNLLGGINLLKGAN